MADVLVYIGAAVVALWGAAHLGPTRAVADSFGSISRDSRLILEMEWIAEGIAHVSVGALAVAVTALDGPGDSTSRLVYRILAAVLIALAGLTAVTGARTPVVWFKACPFVLTGVAVLFLAGSLV